MEKIIAEQCEQLQQDILCILDGLDNDVLDNVCQAIVDSFAILKQEMKNEVQD